MKQKPFLSSLALSKAFFAVLVTFLLSFNFAYASTLYSLAYVNDVFGNQSDFTPTSSGTITSISLYTYCSSSVGACTHVTWELFDSDGITGHDCKFDGDPNDFGISNRSGFSNATAGDLITIPFAGTECSVTSGTPYQIRLLLGSSVITATYMPASEPFLVGSVDDGSGPIDTTTRIIDFTPEDGTTVGTPTDFSLHAYINPDDFTALSGIRFYLHNIDQNLLLSSVSPNDIYLLPRTGTNATTSGDFYFSTSTILADGNYRLQAQLEYTYLFGLITNWLPFGPSAKVTLNHQFIVGAPTVVGSLSQRTFSDYQSLLNGTTSASTTASTTAALCNPFTLDVRLCAAFLFIPDQGQMADIGQSFYENVLTHQPWAYFTRFLVIMTSESTTSLPTMSVPIPMGSYATSDVAYFNLDMGEMVTGAGTLMDGIVDPVYGLTFQQALEPFVQLALALAVVFAIVQDLTTLGKNDMPETGSKTKTV